MDHRFPGAEPAAGHVPSQGKRGCWGAHVIRRELPRFVARRCRLRAQDFARHLARRPARGAADQVRPDCQPQDSESAWAHDPGTVPSARRRGDRMKRRSFITLLGGAAAWPLAARAQQPGKLPTIGFLGNDAATWADWTAAFRQGLNEAGYVEGQNATIEYRWAEGHYDRLPALAADLVGRKVTVIAATSTPAALAAKAATATVPIVFTTGGDPIKLGLVASLNRPGGNVTGVSSLISELGSKRLGLLRELLPATTAITTLVNPDFQDAERQLTEVEVAARGVGLQLIVLRASSEREIDAAFATMSQQGGRPLLVTVDP